MRSPHGSARLTKSARGTKTGRCGLRRPHYGGGFINPPAGNPPLTAGLWTPVVHFYGDAVSARSESQGLPRRLEDRFPPTPPFESPAQQVQQDGNPES